MNSMVCGTSWPATTDKAGMVTAGSAMLLWRNTTEVPCCSGTSVPSWMMGTEVDVDAMAGVDVGEAASCTSRMVCTAESWSAVASAVGLLGSLAWRRRCLWRLGRERKAVGQRGQAKGRSPLCTRACSANRAATLKLFPQTQHTNGRSPLWIRSWSCRWGSCRKRFPHWVHWKTGEGESRGYREDKRE